MRPQISSMTPLHSLATAGACPLPLPPQSSSGRIIVRTARKRNIMQSSMEEAIDQQEVAKPIHWAEGSSYERDRESSQTLKFPVNGVRQRNCAYAHIVIT